MWTEVVDRKTRHPETPHLHGLTCIVPCGLSMAQRPPAGRAVACTLVTLLRKCGESSTVLKAGAKSRDRGGLTDGDAAPLASGAATSSLPATLLVSDAVRDPKMLPRPRREPMVLDPPSGM